MRKTLFSNALSSINFNKMRVQPSQRHKTKLNETKKK